MRTVTMRLAGVLVATSLIVGCSTGPYSKAGFATVERDSKLYVFPYGSEAYENFIAGGSIDQPVTAIGAGPTGQTVVATDGDVLHRYLGW